MNLLNKPIGIQTISLAAVEDIVVWVILAVASAFSSGGSALQGLYTLLLTLAFIGIMVIVIRPIFGRIHRVYLNKEDDCNVYIVVGCFLLLLIASFTTEVMGKNELRRPVELSCRFQAFTPFSVHLSPVFVFRGKANSSSSSRSALN
jgi:Kef-type K+ transport system membrane component KefB